MPVTGLAAQLLALLAPPVCATCRAPVRSAAEALCAGCRRELPWLPSRRCRRCGLPGPCRDCPARGAAFEAAWAPLAYDASARRAVTALKFGGALALADAMAAQMAAGAPSDLVAQAALVPVPLHPSRRRRRGFNQAELLARSLSRRLCLPLSPCLTRRGPASRQLGARRSVRLAPARIDVRVRSPAPPQALLVDDVHTTGATLDACARALRAGGARHVRCLTYARALAG